MCYLSSTTLQVLPLLLCSMLEGSLTSMRAAISVSVQFVRHSQLTAMWCWLMKHGLAVAVQFSLLYVCYLAAGEVDKCHVLVVC